MVAMNVWPTDASDGSVATEARWRKMGRVWAPSGVAAGVGLEMAPTLTYPNLTIRNGACWVDGHYCELLGDQVLTVTANGLAVVRFDPAANTAELLYRDAVSVPAQSPTGTWEQPIAKIVGSALTDMRPLVTQGGELLFANPTARDAWVNPPTGAQVTTLDTGTIWTRRSGAWYPPRFTVVGNASAALGDLNTSTLGLQNVINVAGAVYPYPTLCHVTAALVVGYGSVGVTWGCDIWASAPGVALCPIGPPNFSGGIVSPALQWVTSPLTAEWAVPANAAAGFFVQLTIATMASGFAHTHGGYSAVWYAT